MRPAFIQIDSHALLHNIERIQALAPHSKVIAMVKANAYGCGLTAVLPMLAPKVDAFGVACIEEALAVKALDLNTRCILFQGVFFEDELKIAAEYQFECVLHSKEQLTWLLNTPLPIPLSVWVKVNTGMNRLGFQLHEIDEIFKALTKCPWVLPNLGLMTHFAMSDDPNNEMNAQQFQAFQQLNPIGVTRRSLANSGAIFAMPHTHADAVRPGITLYGVSPFPEETGNSLGLIPVMQFLSAISAIQDCKTGDSVGYGATFKAERPSRIGIVAVGYGDGYPRHILPGTPVWISGHLVPIVGRVSMDTLAVDLTDYPFLSVGNSVELWGKNLPVEVIAKNAGTIPYELLCQVTVRVRRAC